MDKKRKNPFLRIIGVLFLLFIIIYCLQVSGYYETKMHAKTAYTNEKILEFEEDVKSGKEIDLNKYVNEDNKDYSNMFTRLSDKVGSVANSVFSEGLDGVYKVLKTLFG